METNRVLEIAKQYNEYCEDKKAEQAMWTKHDQHEGWWFVPPPFEEFLDYLLVKEWLKKLSPELLNSMMR